MSLPKELLLLIFVHGFKGTDSTFGDFPERLKHLLEETIEATEVQPIVFPAYETKGELDAAVERFTEWLVTMIVEAEAVKIDGHPRSVKVILCGHSMGGLVILDSVINIISSQSHTGRPLWPRIVACLAYDTPYLGLNPSVFKNYATKAYEIAQGAYKTISSFGTTSSSQKSSWSNLIGGTGVQEAKVTSSWSKWAPAAYGVGSALITGAVVGSAYKSRNNISAGYTWVTDHMKYVGKLWDEAVLKKRMDKLAELESRFGLLFKNYYTVLPTTSFGGDRRTFIILPDHASPIYSQYIATQNNVASDEIEAHIGMFQGSTNDDYYHLGLETADAIKQAVLLAKDSDDSGSWHTLDTRTA